MWYPVTVAAPSSEPVDVAALRDHLRFDDTGQDTRIGNLGKAARAHIERYCGMRFASRSGVVMRCDGFADMARLPEAPVTSITSISYIDTDGAAQTLSTDIYELRDDGFEAAVVLKYNQVWPAIRPGSRITVTAVVGYATIPEDVAHAMMMLVGHLYEHPEAVSDGSAAHEMPMSSGWLLSNHRRGV